VATPAFRLVDELVSEGERSPTPPLEIEGDSAGASYGEVGPRRVKTCAKKRKGADQGKDKVD
jgi:hypothetical protein